MTLLCACDGVLKCLYHRQDRTLLQILERLGRVETLLGTMNSREEADRKDGLNSMAATAAAVVHISPQLPPPPPNCPAPPAARRNSAGNEMDGGPKLNIPHQHTMAAHKILWWPSIQELIDPELLKQENYVIDEEQNRGTLRIHGRGEEYSGGDPNFEEDSSYSGTGMEDWNGLTYNIGSEWEEGTQTENGGGPRGDEAANGDQVVPDIHQDDFISGLMADCDGKLRLDSQFVQELLNSYLANIHILHPILDKASITHTVSRFVDFFGSPSQQQQGYNDLGLSNETEALMSSPRSNSNNSIPGSGKRKRSISIPQPQQQNKPRSIPRTVHSALVLLVLALGAVCLHRRPVPGPLPRSPTYPSGFSTSTPPFGTSATPPYSVNTPPYQQTRRELKNIDVIPGLAYFSQAMEIMGALAGSNDLESIQSGLLAGLYWGQLGRVLDSWKWISWSCTGCQILIRMQAPLLLLLSPPSLTHPPQETPHRKRPAPQRSHPAHLLEQPPARNRHPS